MGSRISPESTADIQRPLTPEHRDVQSLRPSDLDRAYVARVGVARHAQSRVVPQHASDSFRGGRRAVTDDDHSRMLCVAHAHATAVMYGYPGGPTRSIE